MGRHPDLHFTPKDIADYLDELSVPGMISGIPVPPPGTDGTPNKLAWNGVVPLNV
jgi:hypothetical protein